MQDTEYFGCHCEEGEGRCGNPINSNFYRLLPGRIRTLHRND